MTSSAKPLLPMAHFPGGPGQPLDDTDPDDEDLPETPPDVVKMLGFDPLDTDWSDVGA